MPARAWNDAAQDANCRHQPQLHRLDDRKAAAAATRVEPGATIVAITCHGAPPAIEGPEHGALAVPFLLAALRQAAADGADAAIIACFDDTGLAVSVPVIAANIRDYGLASHCLQVRAAEVLDLERPRLGRPGQNLGRPPPCRGRGRGDCARLCRHGRSCGGT